MVVMAVVKDVGKMMKEATASQLKSKVKSLKLRRINGQLFLE